MPLKFLVPSSFSNFVPIPRLFLLVTFLPFLIPPPPRHFRFRRCQTPRGIFGLGNIMLTDTTTTMVITRFSVLIICFVLIIPPKKMMMMVISPPQQFNPFSVCLSVFFPAKFAPKCRNFRVLCVCHQPPPRASDEG